MLLALLLTLSMAAPAITGVVKDTSGGAVPGASVTVQTTSGTEQQTVISGSDGRFTFENAPAADAVLVVRAGGFAEASSVGRQWRRSRGHRCSRPRFSKPWSSRRGEPSSVSATRRRASASSPASRSSPHRPSSPTMCCARCRASACSAARAASSRSRRRRVCRCAASARAARAARSCCSTASRSTIRSAAGSTGHACRS